MNIERLCFLKYLSAGAAASLGLRAWGREPGAASLGPRASGRERERGRGRGAASLGLRAWGRERGAAGVGLSVSTNIERGLCFSKRESDYYWESASVVGEWWSESGSRGEYLKVRKSSLSESDYWESDYLLGECVRTLNVREFSF
jgi:hypothetical protein